MLELYHTGGGCMAYRIVAEGAPTMFAYVTDDDGSKVPKNLETDPIMLGVYNQPEDGSGVEPLGLVTLVGRAGLMDWLSAHTATGARVDGEDMLILVERVASQMILQSDALAATLCYDNPTYPVGAIIEGAELKLQIDSGLIAPTEFLIDFQERDVSAIDDLDRFAVLIHPDTGNVRFMQVAANLTPPRVFSTLDTAQKPR